LIKRIKYLFGSCITLNKILKKNIPIRFKKTLQDVENLARLEIMDKNGAKLLN
jgi:hypothetical protein